MEDLQRGSAILANNAFAVYSSQGQIRYPEPIEEADLYLASQAIAANSSVEWLIDEHNIRPISLWAIMPTGENVNGTLTIEIYDELGTTVYWTLSANMTSGSFGNAYILTFPYLIVEKNRRCKLTTSRALAGVMCYCRPVGTLEKYSTL